jgi:hypothetical protein
MNPEKCLRRVLGFDPGQCHDPSALALIEEIELVAGFDRAEWRPVTETRFQLPFLERLPLGTPYPDVVARVRSLAEKLHPDAVLVDGTGVGAPVVDLLRRAALGCRIVPVAITSGHHAHLDHAYWMVPKRDLISGLRITLHEQRLRVAGGIPEAAAFLKELQEMRVKIGPAGREQFGAWREGAHDDLVLAVALAHWWLSRPTPPVSSVHNPVYPVTTPDSAPSYAGVPY